jgi:hypothetical protein
MKTRFILLLSVAALATLSFTFSVHSSKTTKVKGENKSAYNEPAGGFVSEDKL